MVTHISGEEHRQMVRQQAGYAKQRRWYEKPLVVFGTLAALLAVIVIGGLLYVKPASGPSYNPTAGGDSGTMSPGTNSMGQPGGGSGSQNGGQTMGPGSASGKVTAISATSITIQPSSGAAQTFAITSSTSIVNARDQKFGNSNASQLAYSDIHTGDTVVILPDSANASQSASIMLNP